jgi:hypothetical protein
MMMTRMRWKNDMAISFVCDCLWMFGKNGLGDVWNPRLRERVSFLWGQVLVSELQSVLINRQIPKTAIYGLGQCDFPVPFLIFSFSHNKFVLFASTSQSIQSNYC